MLRKRGELLAKLSVTEVLRFSEDVNVLCEFFQLESDEKTTARLQLDVSKFSADVDQTSKLKSTRVLQVISKLLKAHSNVFEILSLTLDFCRLCAMHAICFVCRWNLIHFLL